MALLTSTLAPPDGRRSELHVARRAMACEFSVAFPGTIHNAVDAGCAALDEVERLEQKLSAFSEDSELSRLNAEPALSPVRMDPEVYRILRWASNLSAATGGAFDAASGALVKAWGFFRGPRRVPQPEEIAAALNCSGFQHVEFDDTAQSIRKCRPGLEFNLGAIGKGFAIDQALQVARQRFGVRYALMQGGQSSLKAIGAPPGEPRGWVVSIANPLEPGRTLAHVRLRDRALGTSAATQQFFVHNGRRYGHILDPRSGWPAGGVLSASVIAATATEADALSTAFFVMGPEETLRFCKAHPGLAAVLVTPGRVLVIGKPDVEVMV